MTWGARISRLRLGRSHEMVQSTSLSTHISPFSRHEDSKVKRSIDSVKCFKIFCPIGCVSPASALGSVFAPVDHVNASEVNLSWPRHPPGCRGHDP